ncbi:MULTISPECIES: hypothetical protein [unclassified Streptomyces]|uniref:hypothetical protein n=1 Tax=unclassified Streptomyces TaxID=2593676 RepID=UPI0037F58044
MRKMLGGTGVLAGTAALLMAAMGTATAAPVGWSMPGGQGSTYGSFEFYNRSVGVTGRVESHISGCIQATFQTYPGNAFETRTACNNHTTGFDFTMSTDFAGGASSATVTLVRINSNETVTWLGSKTLNRP